MKCEFCGKELEKGAEFCPECGMILSLGAVGNDVEDVAVETEIPEYTPNVFRAMDFEEEITEPAKELEVNNEEEAAEVVEFIPEYTEEEQLDVQEVQQEEPVIEESFTVPEYNPEAQVSPEFVQELEKEKEEEVEIQQESAEETAEEKEPEYAPPEYVVGAAVAEATVADAEEIQVIEHVEEEELADSPVYETEEAEVQQDAYPEYNIADEPEDIPEEKPEDETLFAALFEDAESEKIEDITPVEIKAEKPAKKSFMSIALIVVLLVGVVFAGGYVFKNVLPKIVDTGKSTTFDTQEVDGTTKTEKTTNKDKSTTKAEKTTEKTSSAEASTKETTTKESTTKEATTKETTTKVTTTKAEESEADDEAVVKEPESYNVDEVPFFPTNGDISIKAGPTASSADMITHPYGYPVYAYAKQGSFYYVHSPYLDFMGWVSAKDVTEYVDEEATEAPSDKEESTEAAQPEEEKTDAPEQESSVNYLAMINSAEGLNFRTGPGADYGADIVVPGGFYVRVTAVSEDNPGWVYVTVEDDRYPYGNPSGWVLEDYLV